METQRIVGLAKLRRGARPIVVVGLLVAMLGCVAAESTSSPSATSGTQSTGPSAAPSAIPTPASPTPDASGAPSTAVWSEPRPVGSAGQCQDLAAVIDNAAIDHIVAGCDGKIRYSVQVGADWDTTEFAPPSQRLDHWPQLAFDGDLLYLAYTRLAVEEGGCGDDGLRDVGVYVRTRTLPDGAWSDPRRIGEIADQLQGLRVVDGTIHASIENADDGRFYYETVKGASAHRYAIPKATGQVALRIGDDGKARIAYESDGTLRYGVFTGSKFSTTLIAGTDRGFAPLLVLGAGNRPYLIWYRGNHLGGCAEPDPLPEDGTYFGTLDGDAWQSEQLTTVQGAASLTVDVDTGGIHLLVSDQDGLMYLSGPGSGSWSQRKLADGYPMAAVIRLDPRTGALLVAYIGFVDDANRVYVTHYR